MTKYLIIKHGNVLNHKCTTINKHWINLRKLVYTIYWFVTIIRIINRVEMKITIKIKLYVIQ